MMVDPYEVAYLRGGRNELARVVIVSLVERRILELQEADNGSLRSFIRGSKYIAQKAMRPPRLSELEQSVYEWFAQPRSITDVFRYSLAASLAPYCLPLEERLQRQQLLHSEAPLPASIVAVGVLAIAAAGAGLTFAGLAAGAPVVLPIVMSIAGIVVLLSFGVRRRLTAAGKAYLKKLGDRQADARQPLPYAFAAAVAGTTALAGTPLADLGAEFKKSQQHYQAGATGCGGGCGGGGSHGCGGGGSHGCGGGGSSCGGGSGCGGGGCGGGGCGGGS